MQFELLLSITLFLSCEGNTGHDNEFYKDLASAGAIHLPGALRHTSPQRIDLRLSAALELGPEPLYQALYIRARKTSSRGPAHARLAFAVHTVGMGTPRFYCRRSCLTYATFAIFWNSLINVGCWGLGDCGQRVACLLELTSLTSKDFADAVSFCGKNDAYVDQKLLVHLNSAITTQPNGVLEEFLSSVVYMHGPAWLLAPFPPFHRSRGTLRSFPLVSSLRACKTVHLRQHLIADIAPESVSAETELRIECLNMADDALEMVA
ncbi:hypothetical protein V8E53_006823 [Lactarius tabidus]